VKFYSADIYIVFEKLGLTVGKTNPDVAGAERIEKTRVAFKRDTKYE
jgi:hypothetical protein